MGATVDVSGYKIDGIDMEGVNKKMEEADNENLNKMDEVDDEYIKKMMDRMKEVFKTIPLEMYKTIDNLHVRWKRLDFIDYLIKLIVAARKLPHIRVFIPIRISASGFHTEIDSTEDNLLKQLNIKLDFVTDVDFIKKYLMDLFSNKKLNNLNNQTIFEYIDASGGMLITFYNIKATGWLN